MILDTCFIIDFLKGNREATAKITELEKKNTPIATTTINVFEICQGVPTKASEEKTMKINEFFGAINIIGFDFEAAIEAGNIQRKLSAAGRKIDAEDAMIAGIAKKQQQKVLTRNTRHFSAIAGLEIESY